MNWSSIIPWFDNEKSCDLIGHEDKINWLRSTPFIALHLSLFFGFWLPVTSSALVCCFVSYVVRMFAITAFYHRYFSHKTFSTYTFVEVFFAILGACSGQRGPLWWASHHRAHHKYGDTPLDSHSPLYKGFFTSHMLWFLTDKNFHIQWDNIKDLKRKKYLQMIDRFDGIIPVFYLGVIALIGYYCSHYTMIKLDVATSVYWGFCVSTVLLMHITFCINSIAHLFGTTSYPSKDHSKNNWFLALVTLGEGWHNNHHYYPISCKQGFNHWQLDLTYYLLVLMKHLGLVQQIINIPEHKIKANNL